VPPPEDGVGDAHPSTGSCPRRTELDRRRHGARDAPPQGPREEGFPSGTDPTALRPPPARAHLHSRDGTRWPPLTDEPQRRSTRDRLRRGVGQGPGGCTDRSGKRPRCWAAAPTTSGTPASRSGSAPGWTPWSAPAVPDAASRYCTRCTPRCLTRRESVRTAGSTQRFGSGTSPSDDVHPRGTPGGHALIDGGIWAVRGETRPRPGHSESNSASNAETPSHQAINLVRGGLSQRGGARIRTWEG
jgi:hypothetical protein